MIFVGSFGIPLALLLFFWEMNVRRNVSLYQVIKLFLAGGVLSLITSLIFFQFLGPALGWLSHSAAGIIEETGKLIALLLVTGKVTKYRWTLNGLLLGATIGAGFAAFESAGYALKQIFDYGLPRGIYEMLDVIRLRALLAPGMHIAWTALVGAALWKVKGDQPFRFDMLQDPRFLRAFLIAMALHMLWNSPLSGKVPFYGLNIGLTVVAWFFIIHYVNDGLQQVRQAQAEASPAPVAEPEAPATAPA